MDTRVLDRDAETGKVILHHYDGVAQKVTIEERFDVEPILDVAHAERGMHSDYRPFAKRDWHKVATIPMSIYMELRSKGIAGDPVAMKRWLNDSSNQLFRTMRGVL